MKLEQSALQRTFTVKHKGKYYYIDYLNSDGQILGLLNRNYWEITDEDREELDIYILSDTTKKERQEKEKNAKLFDKLINFCIKHFDDYKPKP